MRQFPGLIWILWLGVLDIVDCPVICNKAEYRIGDECCPMCSPGNHVYKHCTEFTSTSCVPCIGSTYLDKPNGLPGCIPCRHCDPGFGLMVKHPCTPSSDTVCEPLEGFYCTDPTKDGCKAAQRHSSCEPGQYIRQKGSPSTDTVCTNCTGDTYSDGSFTSCQPHTQCDQLNLQQIKPGTRQSDSECGQETSSPVAVIVCVVVAIALIAAVGIGLYLKKKKKRKLLGSDTEGHSLRNEKRWKPLEHFSE
ncbi:tumor necrosis factor receptor superfamily member 14-like isoform X2 [Esox lucius]|uniref:TNFR-Cys domain-containing protein n=1 Tax=Esox lucius TaxID=8010 RepID=A0AAY5KDX5_ESOLU|nr:tumor necrosis factor receptor superfamily member 14-like isoform X2 [Esox lucius]XP_010891554.1 tumor necrosis factor receptor superfamily member 14-like isoform X2 [Esox lucius]